MIKLELYNDYILVKEKDNKETVTESGLYIPELEGKKEKNVGEVIHSSIENINPGDVVYFRGYSAEDIEIEKEKFLIVKKDNIICKIIN